MPRPEAIISHVDVFEAGDGRDIGIGRGQGEQTIIPLSDMALWQLIRGKIQIGWCVLKIVQGKRRQGVLHRRYRRLGSVVQKAPSQRVGRSFIDVHSSNARGLKVVRYEGTMPTSWYLYLAACYDKTACRISGARRGTHLV
jgi:hypothetical protein